MWRAEAANIVAASQHRSKIFAVVVGDGMSATAGFGWTLPFSLKIHRRRLKDPPSPVSHPCPGCPCAGAPAGLEASAWSVPRSVRA